MRLQSQLSVTFANVKNKSFPLPYEVPQIRRGEASAALPGAGAGGPPVSANRRVRPGAVEGARARRATGRGGQRCPGLTWRIWGGRPAARHGPGWPEVPGVVACAKTCINLPEIRGVNARFGVPNAGAAAHRAGREDSRQRPYFIEHARSHPNPEAKR